VVTVIPTTLGTKAHRRQNPFSIGGQLTAVDSVDGIRRAVPTRGTGAERRSPLHSPGSNWRRNQLSIVHTPNDVSLALSSTTSTTPASASVSGASPFGDRPTELDRALPSPLLPRREAPVDPTLVA
jgi:hypothetical protein